MFNFSSDEFWLPDVCGYSYHPVEDAQRWGWTKHLGTAGPLSGKAAELLLFKCNNLTNISSQYIKEMWIVDHLHIPYTHRNTLQCSPYQLILCALLEASMPIYIVSFFQELFKERSPTSLLWLHEIHIPII